MKSELRNIAADLRKKGVSIKEIAKQLHISQSTASRWCQDISLTKAQRDRLDEYRKKAGMRALQPWIESLQSKKLTIYYFKRSWAKAMWAYLPNGIYL